MLKLGRKNDEKGVALALDTEKRGLSYHSSRNTVFTGATFRYTKTKIEILCSTEGHC